MLVSCMGERLLQIDSYRRQELGIEYPYAARYVDMTTVRDALVTLMPYPSKRLPWDSVHQAAYDALCVAPIASRLQLRRPIRCVVKTMMGQRLPAAAVILQHIREAEEQMKLLARSH